MKKFGAQLISKYGVVGSRPRTPKDRPHFWQRHWDEHLQAKSVRRYVGKKRWDRYRRITTIRNPFDRMVSLYFFSFDKEVLISRDIDAHRSAFRAFILGGKWQSDEALTHIDGGYIITDPIRYEDLHADLCKVTDSLGVSRSELVFPHLKNRRFMRGDHAVSDFYDATTAQRVRQQFAWVFERFDYAPSPDEADQICPTDATGLNSHNPDPFRRKQPGRDRQEAAQ